MTISSVLSSGLLFVSLAYAITGAQVNHRLLELNATHQCLTCADEVCLSGENVNAVKTQKVPKHL
jgi:hypothetical protein